MESLTLQGGFFHICMGVLGISVYGRTQEKIETKKLEEKRRTDRLIIKWQIL